MEVKVIFFQGSPDLILGALLSGFGQSLDGLGHFFEFFKVFDQINCQSLLFKGKVVSILSQHKRVLLSVKFKYPSFCRIWKFLNNSC